MGIHCWVAKGGTCQRPGAVGVCGPAAGDLHPLPPLPTLAVANKFSVVGAGSVSIGTRSPGGGPGGGYLSGGTPPTEELAVVSVGEAMGCVAHHRGRPQCRTLAGGLVRYIGAPTLFADSKAEATVFHWG